MLPSKEVGSSIVPFPSSEVKGANLGALESIPVGSGDNPGILSENGSMISSVVWLDVRATANLLHVTRQAVQSACKEGRLVTKTERGAGGDQYRIRLDSLPQEVQIQYWRDRATPVISTKSDLPPVSFKAQKLGLKRADLVSLYLEECRGEGSIVEQKKMFVARYNAGAWPDLLAELGTTSYQTIERWRKALEDSASDPTALAPKYRRRSGAQARSVTEEQATFLLRYFLRPNQMKTQEVIRYALRDMASCGVICECSHITLRRWLDDYQKENAHIVAQARQGSAALNDDIMPYLERDRNLLEFGDVLVADGHTLNFTIQNPKTGKPKRMTLLLVQDFRTGMPVGWEIMPTESTQAIASAYRRAILTMGFVPRAFLLDNGKAFRGTYFKGTSDFRTAGISGLFQRLGCRVIHAKPYHGQSKPIERFFGSFSEFERMQPTYVGTSIDMKPAHMERGDTWHRSLHAHLSQSTVITVWDAHLAIAEWMKDFISRPQKEALHGLSPAQVAVQSLDRVSRQKGHETRMITREELDYLMMSEQKATLYQNGLKMFGSFYYDDALFRFQKGEGRTRFTIRYDIADRSAIQVYTDQGDFVCKARRTERYHPAAGFLGNDDDAQKLGAALSRQRALRIGTEQSTRVIIHELYPDAGAPIAQAPRSEPALPPEYDISQMMPMDRTDDDDHIALFESDL